MLEKELIELEQSNFPCKCPTILACYCGWRRMNKAVSELRMKYGYSREVLAKVD